MKCLLDTHAFLWAASNSPRLSRSAFELIEDKDIDVFVSIASLWEVAIKLSTGKLRIDLPFIDLAIHQPTAHGIAVLPIAMEHLLLVSRLPFHHRDPFDRLLVAQCLTERMPLLSVDAALDGYGVERIW